MCTLVCHACLEVTEHLIGHKDSTQVIAKRQALLPTEPSPVLLCLISNGANQCMKLACLLRCWLSSFFLPFPAMEAPLRWLVLPLPLPGFVWHPLYFSSKVVQITSKYSHTGKLKTCTKVENLLPSHHPASTIINPRAVHFYLALMLKQIQYIISFYQ